MQLQDNDVWTSTKHVTTSNSCTKSGWNSPWNCGAVCGSFFKHHWHVEHSMALAVQWHLCFLMLTILLRVAWSAAVQFDCKRKEGWEWRTRTYLMWTSTSCQRGSCTSPTRNRSHGFYKKKITGRRLIIIVRVFYFNIFLLLVLKSLAWPRSDLKIQMLNEEWRNDTLLGTIKLGSEQDVTNIIIKAKTAFWSFDKLWCQGSEMRQLSRFRC